MQWRVAALILLYMGSSEAFFNGDVSTIVNRTNRLNLTCYYYGDWITDCEYCVYQYFYNGSSSTSYYDYMETTNIYKSMSQRCEGFSDKTDIGYGICSPLSFELFDISILCICATNMCNTNLTTCRTSVSNQLNSNSGPSVLSSIMPELVTPVACVDQTSQITDTLNASFYCAVLASSYIDIEKCNEYISNNSVLCMISVADNTELKIAIPTDFTKYYLDVSFGRINKFNRDPSKTLWYKETSASFYLNYNVTTINGTETQTTHTQRCFCAQDNCNRDLTSCLNANRSIPIRNTASSNKLSNEQFFCINIFLFRLVQTNKIIIPIWIYVMITFFFSSILDNLTVNFVGNLF